jgi:D-alanine-D-alanine ligase
LADRSLGAVAVLHGRVPPEAPADEQDTLIQAAEVATALGDLGWRPTVLTADLDLGALRRRLDDLGARFVFNLVEAIDGKGSLLHLVPSLLEAFGIPFTGASTAALVLSNDKPRAKRQMRSIGIPTPDWVDEKALLDGDVSAGRRIVKSVAEHASIGIAPDSIADTGAALAAIAADRRRRFGGRWFAETFVEGREFNLALIGPAERPESLPAAEIEFVDFGNDRPHIVDYAAKWDPDDPAYRNTRRRYGHGPEDAALIERMQGITRRCWHAFGLSGYARVDFRVDAEGRPWVLEVNANPCLTSDAGFVAAAHQAGWSQRDVVARIVAAVPGLDPAKPA